MIIQDRSYQTEAVESIFNYFTTNSGNPVLALPTGCHSAGHGILMYDGSIKKVEEVIVGDLLMGPDSQPRKVLNLARGRQEMRKVIPNRGEPFVVNLDHKLNVHVTKQDSGFPCYASKNETITIREYENGSNWYRHLRKLRHAPVQFGKKELPLPPYLIGLMLGDGSTVNGCFNLTTADPEIASYFKEQMESLELIVRHEDKCENLAGCLFAKDPLANAGRANRVTHIFRQLGMQEKRSWEKSIPFIYKTGSREQQYEILAGLLDTDAWYSKEGNYFEYCSTSEQLAKDVVFISRCLGLRAQVKRRTTSCNGVRCKDAFNVCITGELDLIPTRLQRKRASPSSKQKNCLVMGFKLEVLPEDDYYGFTLSGDHLYLDENFVVHHNTGKSIVIARFLQRVFHHYPNQRIMVLTHVKELIQQNHSKLMAVWPNAPAGIHSAGLGKRDTIHQILFGGIASVNKKWKEFGFINLILIDEAHLVSPNEETMYRGFIEALKTVNPHLKVIGFTATPWRLGQGRITEDGIFPDLCFDITGLNAFNRLIAEGYLATLIPKQTKYSLDVDGVHMRGGGIHFR